MSWRTCSVKEVIVYASKTHSIWANLAFEDWIFQNVDLSFRRIMFLWRNQPCVVIGRHQNPWLECNVPLLRERGIELARRRSGGGAVYHDLGNLNVTLFSHRGDYDRQRNLRLVTAALNSRWNTRLSTNNHNDILCRDTWKVSGSSSKLGKASTYHHFTLLLSANTGCLRQYLKPHPQVTMATTTATQSRSSAVVNLQSLHPNITMETVCSAIAEEFYRVHGITENREIIRIDPTAEDILPGISAMMEELQTWEWNYGKTPKFTCTAHKTFDFGEVDVVIDVCKGRVERCHFEISTKQENVHYTTHLLQESIVGCELGRGDLKYQISEHFKTDSTAIDIIVQWLDTLF